MALLLDAFGIDENDPEVIAIEEDFNDFADLISNLVKRRKALGLKQIDVAKRMGTKQSAVSAIESSSANPTIQRLQKYARAVEAKLELSAHEELSLSNTWRKIGGETSEEISSKDVKPDLMPVGTSEWKRLSATHAA